MHKQPEIDLHSRNLYFLSHIAYCMPFSLLSAASVFVYTSGVCLCAASTAQCNIYALPTCAVFCHATCYVLFTMYLYTCTPCHSCTCTPRSYSAECSMLHFTGHLLCTLHHVPSVLVYCLLSPCSHLTHHISPSSFILISGMLEQVHWPSTTTSSQQC